MNKIQDFLKRKGIEDKIVDYDETNEPLTPSYIIEEWEKEQLRIGGVSQQRELLNGFRDFVNKRPNSEHVYAYDINDYLKTIL